jgi:hypothetical protein
MIRHLYCCVSYANLTDFTITTSSLAFMLCSLFAGDSYFGLSGTTSCLLYAAHDDAYDCYDAQEESLLLQVLTVQHSFHQV